jgi:hypothetical protein
LLALVAAFSIQLINGFDASTRSLNFFGETLQLGKVEEKNKREKEDEREGEIEQKEGTEHESEERSEKHD